MVQGRKEWNQLSSRAACDTFLLILVEKAAFACVRWRVRNWLFLINGRTITLKTMVPYNYKERGLRKKKFGKKWKKFFKTKFLKKNVWNKIGNLVLASYARNVAISTKLEESKINAWKMLVILCNFIISWNTTIS